MLLSLARSEIASGRGREKGASAARQQLDLAPQLSICGVFSIVFQSMQLPRRCRDPTPPEELKEKDEMFFVQTEQRVLKRCDRDDASYMEGLSD